MHQTLQLTLAPEIALDDDNFRRFVIQKLRLRENDNPLIRKTRQSIDARSRQVKINVQADVYVGETPPALFSKHIVYPDVTKRPQALIVGCGPAGMFAALRLIELGIMPVLFERGKDVRARRRDLAAINKEHVVNPESNYNPPDAGCPVRLSGTGWKACNPLFRRAAMLDDRVS